MKRWPLACEPVLANFGARVRAWMLAVLAALALAGAAGSAVAAEYVGAELSDVKPEDKVTAANPQPVQLLFEFRTKGAPNGRGTKYLKQQVTDVVKASGLFSEVGETPVANGAVISIVIDNVAAPKDVDAAEAKGFVTGATFFVAGSTVADHYVCTIDFLSGPTAAKITRSANHALYTQIGLINSPPANAVKVGRIKDALEIMTRQIVSNPLNAIGADPAAGFKLASATPAATPSAVAAPVSPPPPPPTPADVAAAPSQPPAVTAAPQAASAAPQTDKP